MNYLTPKQVNEIISIICDEYCVTLDDLKSNSRVHEISEPRAVLCYILYGLHNYSPSTLGRLFNKTHGNICTTSKRVKQEIETDKRYKEKIKRILELVKNYD